jgi:hypothetical protein
MHELDIFPITHAMIWYYITEKEKKVVDKDEWN